MTKADTTSLLGKQLGSWTVLSHNADDKRAQATFYWCRCSCGKVVSVRAEYLKSGKSKSCGCMASFRNEERTFIVSPGTRIKDMTGATFGELTVIRFSHEQGGRYFWECKCTCGATAAFRADHLLRDKPHSCGCMFPYPNQEAQNLIVVAPGKRVKDFTNKTFHRLTALRYDHTNKKHSDVWLCQCMCGTQVLVASNMLGRIFSCGCLRGQSNKNSYDWHVFVDGKKLALRSSYEVIYAEYLLTNGIPFEYEPQRFILGPRLSYTPDFYLPLSGAWVETKGFANPGWLRRRDLFLATGRRLIVIGKESLSDYLPNGQTYDQWLKVNKHKYRHS